MSKSTPKTQKRLVRLLEIVSIVRATPEVRPEAIYEQLEIESSAYYKDKAALHELGFQYHYDRSQKRHVIDKEPFLPSSQLAFSEIFALIMALKQVSSKSEHVLVAQSLGAIKKLIAATEQEEARALLRHALCEMTLQDGFGCKQDHLDALWEAIQKGHQVRLQHRSTEDGEVRENLFRPYVIFFRKRALYVDGYKPSPQQEKGFRSFRVNRIEHVMIEPNVSFPKESDYDHHKRWRDVFYLFGAGEPAQELVIRFSAKAAPYIKEVHWHTSQELTDHQDGGCSLTLRITEPKEAIREFMSWGAEMEVIKPTSARQWLQSTLKSMLAKHKGISSSER